MSGKMIIKTANFYSDINTFGDESSSDFFSITVKGLSEKVVDKAVEIISSYDPILQGNVHGFWNRRPLSLKLGSAVLRCNVFHRFETGTHAYNSAVIWLESTSEQALKKIKDLIEAYDPDVSGSLDHT